MPLTPGPTRGYRQIASRGVAKLWGRNSTPRQGKVPRSRLAPCGEHFTGPELRIRLALAPLSRLASRGARRAGKWPLGVGRPAGTRPAPGPGTRSPGSACGSRRGSGGANGDSLPHAAAADTRLPRRSTGGPRDGDEAGRASGRTGNGAGGTAGGLRASLTSLVEVTRYPIWGARAQGGSGLVRRSEPRRISLCGKSPEERSLTVTTTVLAKCDAVEGVAARGLPASSFWARQTPFGPVGTRLVQEWYNAPGVI